MARDPISGIDAIAKMGRVLTELEALDQQLRAQPTDPLLKSGSLARLADFRRTRAIELPERCTVWVERRTIPGETPDVVEAQMQAIVQRSGQLDPAFRASVRRGVHREPMDTITQPLVQWVREHSSAHHRPSARNCWRALLDRCCDTVRGGYPCHSVWPVRDRCPCGRRVGRSAKRGPICRHLSGHRPPILRLMHRFFLDTELHGRDSDLNHQSHNGTQSTRVGFVIQPQPASFRVCQSPQEEALAHATVSRICCANGRRVGVRVGLCRRP